MKKGDLLGQGPQRGRLQWARLSISDSVLRVLVAGGYSVESYSVRSYAGPATDFEVSPQGTRNRKLQRLRLRCGKLPSVEGYGMGGYIVGGYSVRGYFGPATNFGFGPQGARSGKLQCGRLRCGRLHCGRLQCGRLQCGRAQPPMSESVLRILAAGGYGVGSYGVGRYSVGGYNGSATDFGFGAQDTHYGTLQCGRLQRGRLQRGKLFKKSAN